MISWKAACWQGIRFYVDVCNKSLYSQSYNFSSSHVCMWSWTIRKAECQRNDAFKLWCWRRLLRVPWTARRSNQSILKEINSEYSLERLLLKVQYFGYLMQRANSLEKTWCWERLKAGGEGVIPFSSCLQFFLSLGPFPISQFFASGGQSIGVSASASVLLMNIQNWFPLRLTSLISLQSKGLSRVFSKTMILKN